MKNYFTFLFLLFLSGSSVFGQKVTLVEQVTSASCPPCAAVNPGFNSLLNSNLGAVAVVKYQRGGGNYIDPMWDFNPNEVNSRVVSYYGISSFPNFWVDGTHYTSASPVTQTIIDNANSESQLYKINLTHELNSTKDTLRVEGTFIALADFQENEDVLLKAFTMVVDKEVSYNSAPGTNGEKEFHNVMRKILPHHNGFNLGKKFAGDTVNLSYSYWIDKNELNPDDLYAIAFVQRTPTKEIFQAANSSAKGVAANVSSSLKRLEIGLYPSPADELIVLKTDQIFSGNMATIYNSLGSEITRLTLNKSLTTVDTQSLPDGIYFLSLTNKGQTLTKRFVVNH